MNNEQDKGIFVSRNYECTEISYIKMVTQIRHKSLPDELKKLNIEIEEYDE